MFLSGSEVSYSVMCSAPLRRQDCIHIQYIGMGHSDVRRSNIIMSWETHSRFRTRVKGKQDPEPNLLPETRELLLSVCL